MIPLPGFLPAWVTWKILGGIAVLLVVAGVGYKVYQSGKDAGVHEGSQVQLKTDDQLVKANDAELKAALAAEEEKQAIAKERQAAAEERIAAAREREAKADSDLTRRRQEIDRLPQAAVMPDIRRRLGLHPPEDTSAALYPDEARVVDQALAQLESFEEKIRALQDQQKEHAEADKQRDVRIASLERERDQALSKYNALMGPYVKARNASMKRCGLFKRVFTVGFGCEKKLDLPDPATLAPAEKEKP